MVLRIASRWRHLEGRPSEDQRDARVEGDLSEPAEAWHWNRRLPEGDRPGTYAKLARYVSAEAVRSLRLVTWREQEKDDDAQVAERLYELLREQGIGYAHEGYLQKRGQMIRDPWLLLENGVGTCIDFATTYAAMCLEATVRPLLGVANDHAFVAISPGTMAREPHPSAPLEIEGFTTYPGERDGVLRASPAAVRAALARGDLISIDAALVRSKDGGDFKKAVEQGRKEAEQALLFIDILYLQHRQGYGPLGAPAGHRPIHLHVPADEDAFEEYDSHREIREQLACESGVVVLLGRQGQGKSRLARELARGRPTGGGWFLDASGPQALNTSLAAVELADRGESVAGRQRPEREGYAQDALALLADSSAPWIVVLDNADGDPGLIERLIPRPRAGQLVLITSTNEEWRRVPSVDQFVKLPRLTDDELRDPQIAPLLRLIDGRPLLARAFRKLIAAGGADAETVALHAPSGTDEDTQRLRAQFTLWSALRQAEGFSETKLYAGACAAFLPPDRQPLSAFSTLAGDQGQAAARYLADHGLLTYELQVDGAERTSLRLHRSFGEAIRLDLARREPQLCDQVCVTMAGNEALRDLLDVHGGLDTIDRLTERIVPLDETAEQADLELGRALHGVGALLELQGQTPRSGAVFERAERHLDDGAHAVLLAACKQGRARMVNQHHQKEEPLLREAVEWARSARELLEGVGESGEHCRAMEGLLLEKLSAFPREGENEIELLKQALAVIEEADENRIRMGDRIDPAELARSAFNCAGPRIRLAQIEPALAAEHLDTAMRIYTDVRERRQRIYRRPVHPHIAACIMGEAYVNYYRATLLGADHVQRTRWLREATERAAEALEHRSSLEGSIDLDEVQKAASFMTKVLLARVAAPVSAASRQEAVYKDAVVELEQAGIALAPVPLLPANDRAEIRDALQRWVDSLALRTVVREFGGEVPTSPLADQLEWLEEFSARWDYRKGKERNLAEVRRLKRETERVTLSAGEALGLIGAEVPREDRDDDRDAPVRYEHVLILGGLVRACLARPLHAAKLLRDGIIDAGAVTALGGFRKIAGDEVGMVEKVTGEEVDDEFHAMDAGVRGAFGLTEPVSERGEDSDVLGASWRVREYSGDGLPIRVVAAPSMAPGERRANTPDTYAWFATQLAKLRAGDRVLVVTTEIYVPYQHADALRMLALPYDVVVETVGVVPGKVHPALRQTFGPDKYLQELRSTICAYRALNTAL